MFWFRSKGIDADRGYSAIRKELKEAFAQKGAGAGVRFTEKRGLYVKDSKNDFRRGSQEKAAARCSKFINAGEKLKASINDELKGWPPVDGKPIGDFVFDHIADKDSVLRIDAHTLDIIDDLIVKGMRLSAGPERVRMIDDREGLFLDADDDASPELQKQRAADWPVIVHGNRMLREAIEDDLWQSGFEGDCEIETDEIADWLNFARSGLTAKTLDAAIRFMTAEGYSCDRLRALGDIVNLKQNLGVNVKEFGRINADIEAMLDKKSRGVNKEELLCALRESDKLHRRLLKFKDRGELDDQDMRDGLFADLMHMSASLTCLWRALDSIGAGKEPAVRKLAAFFDEQTAVMHDLAAALLEPKERVAGGKIDSLIPSNLRNVRNMHYIDAGALGASFKGPQTLFQSGTRTASSQDTLKEYNKCIKQVEEGLRLCRHDLTEGIPMSLELKVRRARRLNEAILRRSAPIQQTAEQDKHLFGQAKLMEKQRYFLDHLQAALEAAQGLKRAGVNTVRHRGNLTRLPDELRGSDCEDAHNEYNEGLALLETPLKRCYESSTKERLQKLTLDLNSLMVLNAKLTDELSKGNESKYRSQIGVLTNECRDILALRETLRVMEQLYNLDGESLTDALDVDQPLSRADFANANTQGVVKTYNNRLASAREQLESYRERPENSTLGELSRCLNEASTLNDYLTRMLDKLAHYNHKEAGQHATLLGEQRKALQALRAAATAVMSARANAGAGDYGDEDLSESKKNEELPASSPKGDRSVARTGKLVVSIPDARSERKPASLKQASNVSELTEPSSGNMSIEESVSLTTRNRLALTPADSAASVNSLRSLQLTGHTPTYADIDDALIDFEIVYDTKASDDELDRDSDMSDEEPEPASLKNNLARVQGPDTGDPSPVIFGDWRIGRRPITGKIRKTRGDS